MGKKICFLLMLAVSLLALPIQAQKVFTTKSLVPSELKAVDNFMSLKLKKNSVSLSEDMKPMGARKAPRRVASVDELSGDFMLVSSYYVYQNGLNPASPAQGATPISISKIDDTTIAISGFTSGATELIKATVDVTSSTISIEQGQTLLETTYGPVLLDNAQGDGPITGTISEDGTIYLYSLWYDVIGGDGQYAGNLWSGKIYFSYIAPVSGKMTWIDNNSEERSVSVYVEQSNPKTATVYNFGGFETAVDFSLKADSIFTVTDQLVVKNNNGDFYVYGFTEDESELATLVGTGTEKALAFGSSWTMLSPSTGYWFYLQKPATITLNENYKFDYPVIPDVAAMPANPTIIKVDGYNEVSDYGSVVVNVPVTDTYGNDLLESKLYYQFYSDVDGNIQPIVLPATKYKNLSEDLTLIPYTLDDNFDFQMTQGNKVVYLNFPFDYDRIGVKSVYKGGNSSNETEIQWFTMRIKELPYVNALNTEALFSDFTVIDANHDNSTWAYNADNTAAAYSYNSSNDGDDWLISRPIRLEAGKSYRIALDARNRNYDERFEVKMGLEPSVDGMTSEVIPATVVGSAENSTFENQMVTVPETGYYYIGIHAISDRNMFQLFVNNFVVEAGLNPAAPAAVNDLTVVPAEGKLETTISFTAPTQTAGGEALTSITKIDVLRDKEVIASLTDVTPGAPVQYVDHASNLSLGYHTYQVVAYNDAGAGMKSDEKTVFLSLIYDVPVSFDLMKQSVFNLFQVIDANSDNKTWAWDESYGTYYNYGPNAADDYLISAPVKLEAGKKYIVAVKASSASTSYQEAFRVLIGKESTVEGLNTVVADTTWVGTTDFTNYETEFTVTEGGNYHVAIHGISPSNMWRLNIARLALEKSAEPTAPAAVADLTVTSGAQGALEATVRFTAPTKAIDGTNLTSDMSVNILRSDSIVATLENVSPGTAQSWTERNLEQGMTYIYQVVASNAYGAGLKSETVSVYVGVDAPAAVTNLMAIDNASSVDFDWLPVNTVGANGGYVDPATVNYELWSFKVVQTPYGSSLAYDEKLADVVGKTGYSYAMNTDEGEQDFKIWGVMPVNAAGKGGYAIATMLVGAPYDLPFAENFAEGSFHYVWDYSDNAGLYVSNESSDDDGKALILTAMNEPGVVSLYTGKLSLKNAANPVLLFDVKSSSLTKMSVVANEPTWLVSHPVKEEIPVSSEYTTIQVPLSSLKDSRYIQLGFNVDCVNATTKEYSYVTYQYETHYGDLLMIDNVRIVDQNDGGETSVSTLGNQDARMTVYTIDGKLVNRQATSLNGLKGAYIINNKKVILK